MKIISCIEWKLIEQVESVNEDFIEETLFSVGNKV